MLQVPYTNVNTLSSTQFLETLGGLATIRAFSWQSDFIAQNHTLVDRSQKPFYLLMIMQRWLTLVLELIAAALAVLIVGIAFKVRGDAPSVSGSVSVGFTGVSLTQLISFMANVKILIAFWTQLETSIGAISRIKQFVKDTKDENLPWETQDPPENWPSRGEVKFEKVDASYK